MVAVVAVVAVAVVYIHSHSVFMSFMGSAKLIIKLI